ncbi:MAG: hypothetical protein KatS3mg131_0186 [Candidatus Tectimicrobiota bacterium]|nr:MAG: hypothetical protein KatS3mg131_0186 [Candidatus Tectomicrobia bacterium]
MTLPVSQLLQRVRAYAKTLRTLCTMLARTERLDKDRATNLQKLQQQAHKIRRLLEAETLSPQALQDVRQWLTVYQHELEHIHRGIQQRFATELERLLRAEDLELRGQLPELRAGLFTLEVNAVSGRVIIWYGPKQERMGTAPLTPQAVFHQMQRLRQALSAPFDSEAFLARLFDAYRHAVQREGKAPGEPARILAVLVELALLLQDRRFYTDPRREHFRSYGRVQFSYDLYRLRQRRLPTHEFALVTATRAYTTKRQDFLWVPSNERGEGTVYSHVVFREIPK